MKSAIAGMLVSVALVVGVVALSRGGSRVSAVASVPAAGVSVVDGVQVVTIKVKGGYAPESSVAKVGVPTVLRFETRGTFDCSSSIRIPSLGVSKTLPSTGTTDIDAGVLKPGTLQGTCGMGMYRFEVVAQE